MQDSLATRFSVVQMESEKEKTTLESRSAALERKLHEYEEEKMLLQEIFAASCPAATRLKLSEQLQALVNDKQDLAREIKALTQVHMPAQTQMSHSY